MRHAKSVLEVLVTAAGILSLGGWLFLGGRTEAAGKQAPQPVIAGLPAPLVMISSSDDLTSDGEVLRQEIRAVRVGPNGGLLICGPAALVIPPSAVSGSARFLMEDFSTHMPCILLERSADVLACPTELHISYRGTPYDGSGFDLSALKIYRQASADEYVPMPGYVDLERGCVVAQVIDSGIYIIA